MWSSWITVGITAFAMFLVATVPLLFLEPQSIASITFVCVIVPLFTALASFLHWKMFTSTFRELADGIESARTDLQRKEGGGGKRRVLTGADGTTAAIDVSTTTPQKKRVTANAAHSDIFRLEATVRDLLVGLSESASSPSSRYSSNPHRMQFSSHASSRSGRVDTTAAALDFDELPLEEEVQEEGEDTVKKKFLPNHHERDCPSPPTLLTTSTGSSRPMSTSMRRSERPSSPRPSSPSLSEESEGSIKSPRMRQKERVKRILQLQEEERRRATPTSTVSLSLCPHCGKAAPPTHPPKCSQRKMKCQRCNTSVIAKDAARHSELCKAREADRRGNKA